MPNKPKEISLPIAPSLIGTPEFSQIQAFINEQDACPTNEIWRQVINEYSAWEKSFSGAHTSATNRKLYLYQLLLQSYPELPIKNNPLLTEIILSNIRKPNDVFRMKLPNGSEGDVTVIRREISDRLGVLLTLKSGDGFMFSHEYFD